MKGWIKLHRTLQDWGWRKSPNHLSVFIDLLLEANHEDGEFMGIKVPRGALTTSIKRISDRSGVSEKSVRTILKHLKATNEVAIQTTSKFTMISILKWSEYQLDGEESGKQVANKGQTSGKQVATNKNERIKELKNNILSGVGVFEVEQPTLEEVEDKTSPAIKILNAFNLICGKSFRPTVGNLKPINARLKEGYDYQDFVAVIEHFNKLWSNDPKFSPYLQPTTIFNNKFDGRLEQTKNANIERLDPLDVLFGNVVFPEVSNDA